MGMDFTAILRCDISSDTALRGLDALEAPSRPAPLRAVLQCWQESHFFALNWPTPVWVESENQEAELPARPSLSAFDARLRLPEGFFVTVAKDSIILYHLLRGQLFLTEIKWQAVMFDSLRWFCKAFSASDCVLASHWHAIAHSIGGGMAYDRALIDADRQDVGRIDSFEDLYIELESNSDVAIKPAKDGLARFVAWPKAKPLPPGWSREKIWDSKGYWRFAWYSDSSTKLLSTNHTTTCSNRMMSSGRLTTPSPPIPLHPLTSAVAPRAAGH